MTRRRTPQAPAPAERPIPDADRLDELLPDVDEESADEALREAEQALGVPEWVDPETGQLADDEHVRLEDH
jgi:hypothetical protein